MCNELVKENKLKVHLEAYHTPFVGKDQSFYPRKEQEIKQNQTRSKMMGHCAIIFKYKESQIVFWMKVKKKKYIHGNEALKVLFLPSTTYLFVAGILLLNITETKIWSQLQPEHDVTCSIYGTQPQFENFSKLMQNQGSH